MNGWEVATARAIATALAAHREPTTQSTPGPLAWTPRHDLATGDPSGAMATLRLPGDPCIESRILHQVAWKAGLSAAFSLAAATSASTDGSPAKDGRTFRVEIPVAPHDLADARFTERLLGLLRAAGHDVGIDVHASILGRDVPPAALKNLSSLIDRGVRATLRDVHRTSVDLTMLGQVNVAAVAVTLDPDSGETTPEAVAGVRDLANGMGWRVVVDGIDRHSDHHACRTAGVSEISGRLFSSAPAESLRVARSLGPVRGLSIVR